MLIKCPECSNEVSDRATSCPKCGHPIQAAAPQPPAPEAPAETSSASSTAPPKKSQAGAVAVLIVLVAVIALLFFGNVHIITGSHLDSPRIVSKESFGLSETFIKIDTITSMPWIAAKSRYPLSCAVLAREHLIESDEDFRARRDREMKEEMDKALRNLSR